MSVNRGYSDMGMFLNSKVPYEAYKKAVQDPYFVDKNETFRSKRLEGFVLLCSHNDQ